MVPRLREMRAFAPESSHGPLCVELLWFLSVILGRPDWEEASRPWWSQGGPHSVGGLGLKIPFESVKAVRAALRYQARVRLFGAQVSLTFLNKGKGFWDHYPSIHPSSYCQRVAKPGAYH